MQGSTLTPIASWQEGSAPPAFGPREIVAAAQRFREPIHVVREAPTGRIGVAFAGELLPLNGKPAWPVLATLPALFPEWLGDRSFLETHGLRFPYVTGAMANGIATTQIVISVAKAGMLGFFGAAGLPPERVEKALVEMEAALQPHGLPWGSNLIHSPAEPDLEQALAELYLRRGVVRVCASAFMTLTPAVVRYAAAGLTRDAAGRVRRRNHVFAKVSRPEVATRFLQPAPQEILQALVAQGKLSREEAELAARVPLAEDITVEADSGGHTDNRPLNALLTVIVALRDEVVARHDYDRPVRVGAAGGLGTPQALSAAFALGAAYVLTGTVNQATVESGLSDEGKRMLAEAGIADVMMAPAADMFELGVKVQVLRRGTMFGVRAQRLYDLYLACDSLEAIPEAARARLEKEVFHAPLAQVWDDTRRFFEGRDPEQNLRAERDPKHKMALVFRWYLGKSSKWAIAGDAERRLDYQIWCGPAMGAFNAWVKGSFLADPRQRTAVQVALNLLEGAAAATRAQQLRSYGVAVPPAAFDFRPRPLQ